MEYSDDDINENALYVLNVDNYGKFHTGYFEINKTLISKIGLVELYQVVYDEHPDEQLTHKEIYEIRKRAVLEFYENINSKFHFLMGFRSYCSKYALTSSYCDFQGITSNIDLKIEEYSTTTNNNDIRIKCLYNGTSYSINMYTDDFINSYLIEQAYNECIKDQMIKAYSHRRVGWTSFDFKLNDILSVSVDTNFSFGYSSYFTITLVYKSIKIIPYSRLVLYHFANTMQLIRHTREYSVSDRSWLLSLDFVRDACNELMEGGDKSFIAEYITKECEVLCKLLPNYLVTSEFNLSENRDGTFFYKLDNKLQHVKLEGYPLIAFRVEKVSGAIDFTESIKELNAIIPTQKYIDCIFECCLNIKPTIDDTLFEIEEKIPFVEIELNEQVKLCDDVSYRIKSLNDQLEKLNRIKEDIREKIYQEFKDSEGVSSKYSNLIVILLNKKFEEQHPEYAELKSKSEALRLENKEQCDKRDKTSRKLVELRNYINSLTRHNEIITSFIEKSRVGYHVACD